MIPVFSTAHKKDEGFMQTHVFLEAAWEGYIQVHSMTNQHNLEILMKIDNDFFSWYVGFEFCFLKESQPEPGQL